MSNYDIGLIGLAVMGENLVLNMESHGFSVAVFNRTISKVDAFMEGHAKGKNIKGCHSIEELTKSLKTPLLRPHGSAPTALTRRARFKT